MLAGLSSRPRVQAVLAIVGVRCTGLIAVLHLVPKGRCETTSGKVRASFAVVVKIERVVLLGIALEDGLRPFPRILVRTRTVLLDG